MFNVFNSQLVYLGELEGITSAMWSDCWDDIGGISITAALTPNNERLLQNGNFVEISQVPGAPGVERELPPYLIIDLGRNESAHTITVNGKTADYLLERRIVPEPHFADTSVPEAARQVLESNRRGLPLTVGRFADDGREEPLAAITLESGTLDETVFSLLRFGGYGRQLRRVGDSIAFLIDSGRDKRYTPSVPVVTSDNGSVRQAAVEDDDSMTRNVAAGLLHYAAVSPEMSDDPEEQESYQDAQSEMLYIGQTEATGADRRELWCGDYFQAADESDEDFVARASADMRAQMLENVRVLNLSADIRSAEYGTVYRTGDLMRAKSGDYQFQRRINAVNWTLDKGAVRCELRLGPPTITVLRELQQRKPMSSSVSGGIGGAISAAGDAQKKVLDLHNKWLAMVIALGEVEGGLYSEIHNFDDFLQAYTKAYAQTVNTAAGLEAVATEDVINQLKEAKTTLFASVKDAISDCVQTAYLELYAVSDGTNTKTLAELVADAAYVRTKETVLDSLLVDVLGRLHAGKGIYSDGSVTGNSIYANGTGTQGIVSGRRVSCLEFALNGAEYTPTPITSKTGPVTVLAHG